MKRFGALICSVAVFVAGCASSGGPRMISYEEASEFENSLRARDKAPISIDRVFTQPVNKTEPCKLPTSPDQLARDNFRAYWDGDCKDGFAYGLGRDIAISDTHHYEEITIHDGTGDNWSQPGVFYDFVNNFVRYAAGGAEFPASTQIQESYSNSYSGFTASQAISVTDENGNVFVLQTSPFSTLKYYLSSNVDGAFLIRFSDNSVAPFVDQNSVVFGVEIFDPRSNVRGGVGIVRYGNGAVQHFKVVNSEPGERVVLPADYVSHIESVYQSTKNAVAGAIPRLQGAQQIEREYLFKVCSGKGGIIDLDQETYLKVCTWRDQFKEPYAAASERFQQQLENMRARAETAEQQRRAQEQIALQRQMIQQQKNQQAWNEINRANEQIRQSSQQMLQSVISSQAPQVQSLSLPSRNVAVCHTIGSIVTCQ